MCNADIEAIEAMLKLALPWRDSRGRKDLDISQPSDDICTSQPKVLQEVCIFSTKLIL